MTIRIDAIAVVLAVTVLTVAAQGEKSGFLTTVIPEKQTVRLGDPIAVSVNVSNRGPKAAELSGGETRFNCFEVTGPDGKRLGYVGFDGQFSGTQVSVPPSSTLTIAKALDLTDRYLFEKPGRYSVRFATYGWSGLSDSPAVAIEVTPGRLSEFDEVAVALLPVCPAGWHLAKNGLGEIMPFGRSRGLGFELHLCRNHMSAS